MQDYISQLKKAFSLNLDVSSEERDLTLNRLFCLVGVVFTPIITIAIWEFQETHNRVMQLSITVLFLFLLLFSFKYKKVKKNIKNIIFSLLVFLCIYTIIDAGNRNFSFQSTFGLSILLFISALVISTKKQTTAFYVVITLTLMCAFFYFEARFIDKRYLAVFFAAFITVGFILTRYKVNTILRLQERESFIRTVFDQTIDAVLITDHYSKKIVSSNDAALKLFEIKSTDEIIGLTIEKFETSKAEKIKGENRQEKEFITAKGKSFWADVAKTPINTWAGKNYVIRITDITEKKAAQEKISKSEESYRLLVENMNEGLMRVNDKEEIEYVNQRLCEMLDYKSKEELVGKNGMDVFPLEEDIEKQKRINSQRLKGISTKYETRMKKKNGGYVWALISGTPVFNDQNKVIASFGIVTDITEIKKSQQELKKSEENYRSFIERNLAGVYRTDMHRTMLDCNDAMAQILGYEKREQIIGKKAEELYEFSTDSHDSQLKKLIKAGSLKSHESKVVLKGGKEIWMLENTSVVKNSKGEPTMIEGTILDITEIKETTQALNESQERLGMMLKSIDEVVYNIVIDNEGKRKIEYISPQVKQVFGYTQDEFNDGKVELTNRYHPEDKNSLKEQLKVLQEKKQAVKFSYRFKHLQTQEYRWIEESIFPLFNEENQHIANFGIARDVTERKETEEIILEKEERYRTIVESNPEAIVVYNFLEHRFIDCNKNALKLFGYSKKELLKIGPLEVSPKHQANKESSEKKARKKIEKALKKEAQTFEWIHVNKKGEEIPTEVKLARFSEKDDNLILATITDISERKRTEEIIKNSEARLKLLSEETNEGIVLTEKGVVFDANLQFAKMHGYTKIADIIGKKANDFVSEKYHNKLKESLTKEEVNEQEEYVNVKKDGTKFYVESRGRNFVLNGKKVRISVLVDITHRKEYEKEKVRAEVAEKTNTALKKEIEDRKKAEKKLQENEQFTRRIIDSSLDMICASDKDGNITEFNRAAEITFGYSQQEIIGKPIESLYNAPQERKKITKELLQGEGSFIGEIVNKRKSGETFTTYLSASALKDEQGNIIGMMEVSRDISNIKQAEAELRDSEERYSDLFENATDLIQSVNDDGTIAYVNNAWKKTMGYTDEEIKQKNIYDFIHPDSKKTYKEICEAWFKNPYPIKTIEVDFITKSGNKVMTLGSSNSRQLENGKIASRTILKDITEQKEQQKIQQVYDVILDIIATRESSEEMFDGIRAELQKVIDVNEMYISFQNNDEEEVIFPYYRSLLNKRNYKKPRKQKRGFTELAVKNKKPYLLNKSQLEKLEKKENLELSGKTPEQLLLLPLKIEGKPIGAIVIQSYNNAEAYTEESVELLEFISSPIALAVQRMFDEEKINDQAARLNSIIESASNLLIWTLNKKLEVTSYNRICELAFNKSFGEQIEKGKNFIEVCRPYVKEDALKNLEKSYKQALKGSTQQFEGKGFGAKGRPVWLELFLNPIYKEDGSIEEVSCIAVDITDKKEAEVKLRTSLEEKSVLLKEVHHRVKNNLQVISSILNLQSAYVKDDNTLTILRESQDRIKSMSFIHESLYQTKDLAKINFSDYILNLSQNLVHSYQVTNGNINLNINVDRVYLNIDQAIPCGLITNELVANSLKYAFPNGRKGSVNISVKDEKGVITMQVGDDGIGLPEDFDINETETLGLQLVTSLVEQLNGEINVKKYDGTSFIIKFEQQNK